MKKETIEKAKKWIKRQAYLRTAELLVAQLDSLLTDWNKNGLTKRFIEEFDSWMDDVDELEERFAKWKADYSE